MDMIVLPGGRTLCSGMAVPFRRRWCRTGRECVQGLYGILRLGRTRAVWWRSVLWQADMMLLGGLGDGGQRLFALVGGVVVGLLELGFLVLVLVVFWLLLLRVGIEQRREERHVWQRCCQRISRCRR